MTTWSYMYDYIESCSRKNAEKKKTEEETAEFHSCVLLTPELKQMKKDVFITLRNPGRIDY